MVPIPRQSLLWSKASSTCNILRFLKTHCHAHEQVFLMKLLSEMVNQKLDDPTSRASAFIGECFLKCDQNERSISVQCRTNTLKYSLWSASTSTTPCPATSASPSVEFQKSSPLPAEQKIQWESEHFTEAIRLRGQRSDGYSVNFGRLSGMSWNVLILTLVTVKLKKFYTIYVWLSQNPHQQSTKVGKLESRWIELSKTSKFSRIGPAVLELDIVDIRLMIPCHRQVLSQNPRQQSSKVWKIKN